MNSMDVSRAVDPENATALAWVEVGVGVANVEVASCVQGDIAWLPSSRRR